jgi:hypothetical protein
MNSTKHVVLLTSNIFGRGFDSRRLHHTFVVLMRLRQRHEGTQGNSPSQLATSFLLANTNLTTFLLALRLLSSSASPYFKVMRASAWRINFCCTVRGAPVSSSRVRYVCRNVCQPIPAPKPTSFAAVAIRPF